MLPHRRWSAEWPRPLRALRVVQPAAAEVARAAGLLVGYYHDPHNSAMMTNTVALSIEDVVEHYRGLRESGGRGFLLLRDHALVGDADLRRIGGGSAEMAILVGERS